MQANNPSKSAIVLNGSPRHHGNTSVVTQWLCDNLVKHNWSINLHNLYDLNIKGCSHCNKCKNIANAPGCVIKDDLIEILNQIVNADLIVISSPVYCWKVSGCMSATLDRFYSLFKDKNSLIKDKQMLGIFTAGGGALDGIDLCIEMLKRLCDFGSAKYMGAITATNCTEPKELNKRESLKTEIAELSAQISK